MIVIIHFENCYHFIYLLKCLRSLRLYTVQKLCFVLYGCETRFVMWRKEV